MCVCAKPRVKPGVREEFTSAAHGTGVCKKKNAARTRRRGKGPASSNPKCITEMKTRQEKIGMYMCAAKESR